MPFSLGGFELLAIVAVVLPTIGSLVVLGYPKTRWLVAVSVCLIAAAVVTPADVVTTVVLSIAFIAVLMLGAKMRLFDRPVAN